MEKNKILDERQYGFRKGKNINQLLGKFANTLNNNMRKGLHSLILFDTAVIISRRDLNQANLILKGSVDGVMTTV